MIKFIPDETHDSIMPCRATKGSAGYDFAVPFDIIIPPDTTKIIDTGIKVSMDSDTVLLLFVRSSLGIKGGVTLANGTGVIDSDFPETIKIALHNGSVNGTSIIIPACKPFAQGVFVTFKKTDDDSSETERTGGIGSTDAVTSKPRKTTRTKRTTV